VQLKGNTYTFVFALIVCVICSFSLAAVSRSLKPRQELNFAMDIKKNILKAVGLQEPISPQATPHDILEIYNQKIRELVIDAQGNVVADMKPEMIKAGDAYYPLYVYQEGETVLAYAFPMVGHGLWSTLYGYLALEPDGVTIRGITYYKHGETPGLGAEIEKDWFQNNFKGKTIWDIKANELRPITVAKGPVSNSVQDEYKAGFYVDGISGATLTGKGVTEMIARELKKYDPYFSKIRKI